MTEENYGKPIRVASVMARNHYNCKNIESTDI
jgi:hypothetical protein